MKDDTTDFGFTRVGKQEKQKLVTQVFDSVADKYDLMNDAMSLGIHRLWKRHAINLCQLRPGQIVLDLAAGTGDLARLIAPQVKSTGKVVLCDLNFNMLQGARTRLIDSGLVENTRITVANAEKLPFPNNTFDRIIIGFGLRNVTSKELALAQMAKALKPGGRLVVLEFSHPPSRPFAQLYDAYSFHVLPWLGKLIANDSESYRYLVESIRMHPNQETLKNMMLNAGFDQCSYQNLTGGIVAVHVGEKY